jgi:GNAT superfamily N-acetyltransferase
MFVDPSHRGKGIGKAIMAPIMAHPDLQDLRRWVLVTGDAHGLYAGYGFDALATQRWHHWRRTAHAGRSLAHTADR